MDVGVDVLGVYEEAVEVEDAGADGGEGGLGVHGWWWLGGWMEVELVDSSIDRNRTVALQAL